MARSTSIILAVFAVLVSLAYAGRGGGGDVSYDGSKDVVVLTPDNFDDFIKNNDGFIEFYAPWCGHCKSLKPIWEEAASTVKDVKFAAIDADKHNSIGSRYGVRGFPTILYFKDGEKHEYEGGRSVENFKEFAKKMSSAAFTELAADKLEDFYKSKPVVIVGKFVDAASDAAKAFKNAAKAMFLNYAFGLTSGDKDSVVIKIQDDEDQTLDTDFTEDNIKSFVQARAAPLVEELNQNSFQSRVMPSTVGNFLLFVDPEQAESNEPLTKSLRNVAKAFRGKGNFFTVNGVEFGDFAKNLDVDEKLPGLAVLDMAKQSHFAFEGEMTEEGMTKFVQDFIDNKLVRELKSAPIPEESHDGAVRVLVGKNFKEVALDPTKDVLVEFYAPWCGHCKKLAPIYSKVADYLKPIESLVIAKIDMDANEVEAPHTVEGFPTLRFFPAKEGVTKGIEFDGARNFKEIVKFIKKNAAIEFKLPAVQKTDDGAKEEL